MNPNLIDNLTNMKGVNSHMLLGKTELDTLEQASYITQQIIEGLSPEAILELLSASDSKGIDDMFDNMFNEVYRVLFSTYIQSSQKIEAANLGYLDKLSNSVEEELRCKSLSYFITSCLPHFEMSWHHYQWSLIPELYRKFLILASRDHGKCIAPETLVRMFDGTLKQAKDVKQHDLLMGDDGTPRKALHVGNGKDKMYWVHQKRAMSYKVNSKHTMYFHRAGKYIEMDMQDFINKSDDYKSKSYGVRSKGYDLNEQDLKIEPYYLGLWLGDGDEKLTKITNIDPEPIQYMKNYAEKLDMIHTSYKDAHCIVNPTRNPSIKNRLREWMSEYNVLGNKHIPQQYLLGSRRQRLELLAGLIDSDGNLHDGCYYISQTRKQVCLDIQQLCYTLGYRCTLNAKKSKFKRKDGTIYESDDFIVCITGDLHEIPVLIARKKKVIRADLHKNFQHSKIDIEEAEYGEYISIQTDGNHLFQLEDGTICHNSYMFSNAFPAWQLYKYKPKTPKEKINNRGFLFSFSMIQAIDLLEILKSTIEDTDVLRDRLYNKDSWSKMDITCKNRARLTVKGFGSAVRGAHPYWIMIDDGLKDNVLYSSEQNQKTIDYFHAVVENLLVPNGQLGIVGTPFRSNDLYGHLKTKENWKVFEYPGIFPDGTLLWENRWDYAGLMDKRKSQGNLIFSREILVKPITSDSTIFPIEILNTAFLRMEGYTLVNNRDSFPVKFNKVVTGCDFAISGNVGSDYSVYLTWGIDESEKMWLLNVVRGQGMSYHEQIGHLKWINANFRPDLMAFENNIFQQIFVEGAEKAGLPVIGINTSKTKNDLREGLPSLAIAFERGMFRIPTGDQKSKDFADLLVSEFSSVAFTDKGLQSTNDHDDIAFATYKSVEGVRKLTINSFDFSLI